MSGFQNLNFESTHWSVVLRGGQQPSPDSRAALETLCQSYWHPLYAYVRRRGYDTDEAQDLTQDFFHRLLEKNTIANADPHRGRFRSFLLASMRNFLANEWDRAHARKRGGGNRLLSLDFAAGESSFRQMPTDDTTPELLYEKRWAELLVDTAMERLRAEYAESGRDRRFEALKTLMAGRRRDVSHRRAARELGISEAAAAAAVSRLRRRFRELLRAEISQTVASEDDAQDEIHTLFRALGTQ